MARWHNLIEHNGHSAMASGLLCSAFADILLQRTYQRTQTAYQAFLFIWRKPTHDLLPYGGVSSQQVIDNLQTLRRQLDKQTATILWIWDTDHQPHSLQLVDAVGHGAGGDAQRRVE